MPRTAEAPIPLVIVLSGTSSSGKTSLARALHRRLAVPALLVEADRTFPIIPLAHPRWPSLGRSGADVALTFHQSIAVWAERGFNLIVDGSFPYEDWRLRDACIRILEPFDLRVVGVRCSDAELARREMTRPEDRPTGWAVQQAKDIHDGMCYAAEVDTTGGSPDACADDLATQLGLSLIRPAAR